MFDFSKIDGFDWDEGNQAKNWDKHEVATIECEEVFFNRPLLLLEDPKHSTTETRYFALGRTNLGRELFISLTIRETKLRVISARPMSRKERKTYVEANS